MPYQSPTIEQDIERDSHWIDTKQSIPNYPFKVSTQDNSVERQCYASYHNPKLPMYRLDGYVYPTWWSDHFDWEQELLFEVQRFDAQFGERYDAHTTSVPSYEETRLIYGR